MTASTDLRDEIAAKITTELSGDGIPVDICVIPEYRREDVKDPRVCVMAQGIDPESLQELDRYNAVIGIGVIGARPQTSGTGVSGPIGYLADDVAKADEYEALIQRVSKLWVPDGELSQERLAGFRFLTIERPVPVDPDTYRDRSVWLSVLLLTYVSLEED